MGVMSLGVVKMLKSLSMLMEAMKQDAIQAISDVLSKEGLTE